MQHLLVPAGWTFEVKTWENDGDHYNTKRHTVQTIEAAQAVKALLELFKTDNKVSNVYDPNDFELSYIADVFMRWAHEHELAFAEFSNLPLHEHDEDSILDTVVSGIGYSLGLSGNSDFYTRSVENYKIFRSENDIFVDEVTQTIG